MAKFSGGVKAAAELLAGLDTAARRRLLEEIRHKDPQMAEALEKNMVTFEDLVHLTPKMMAELMREIEVYDLAMGLRISSEKLKSHILSHVSKGAREDIEEVLLGPPQSVQKVEESIEKVMKVVREKVDRGELILSPSSDEYV